MNEILNPTVFVENRVAMAPLPAAITLNNVSKRFAMFSKPEDRLKQMVVPRMQRTLFMRPSRYFKEFSAVKNVSLTIGRGETIGIIGRNGSGKSTLLQMIVGTLTPTSGTVEVDGRIAALLELGAGFNPEFTGRENVYVNGAILGFSREEMDARFEAIAAFAAIGDFIEHPVKTYSSGMFVRLAFAVATAVEPDILIVDEALSVGDEAFQRKCFARIEAIKERGGTILFVSHGAQTIVQLCDRAVLLDGGEKILEGEPKLVVAQYQRLINASSETEADIRRTIVSIAPELGQLPGHISDATPTSNMQSPQETIDDNDLSEQLDPALTSHSIVAMQPRGAFISDVRMTSMRGNLVNVLKMGRRYKLIANINFTGAASHVAINVMFRTVQGASLGGEATNLPTQNDGLRVSGHQKLTIEFAFQCNFLPSTYFCNVRVIGNVSGEVEILHRLVDAYAFRIDPVAKLTSCGHVDLGILPNVIFLPRNNDIDII